ncbi:hypothetical protein I350_08246 [Cryptococcus amylolentus CBS 6273]|uniref:Major facilitator superfamily (MFS) profile domain-containing protein n=1 Tax=Cryptococcus amylolentus CBS 6273 TaxID=1296118 RepID=A0A1E3J5W4_9TREE|nr:hypothetical protein I350_08246 [Cryptococcus amylolentus CBS 6273]
MSTAPHKYAGSGADKSGLATYESVAAHSDRSDEERGTKGVGVEHDELGVSVVDKNDTSVKAIIEGKAGKPLTNFERKAALINAEINKFGFGRYQICIWFLCGFGYFLDLAWSQGVGLAASAIYQEMGVPAGKQGIIYSCANAGLAFGALFFGLLVDSAPKFNYPAICAIYFLSSLGLGGNIPIDATIALEFLPQNRRFLVALLSMWQPIGVVVASAIAFGTAARYRCDTDLDSCKNVADGEACCSVSSNMGWRYEFIILGCMTLLVFFVRYFIFTFHESPKFLLSKGRYEEAIEVLHKIAAFNKMPPPTLTAEQLYAIDREHNINAPTNMATAKHVWTHRVLGSFKHLKGLFTNRLQMFIFALLAVAYMGDYWSFNLAGSFLPIVLLNHNVSDGATTVTETYRQYVYIYLPGIIGAVLALFSIQLPLVGRKWSLVFSAAMQGLSMAMYTQVRTTAGYVGLNALEYVMQTYFNAVLYSSAPELFDTTYRGSASGQKYLASNSSGILWLGAGGIWLAAFVMIFLPVEMRNRQMF